KNMTDEVVSSDMEVATDGIHSGLTRRQFLLASGTTAAGAVLWAGCGSTPPAEFGAQFAATEFEAQSRIRVSEDVLSAFENWYATSCQQCDAGCGVIVRIIEGRSKKVEGNPEHPVNRGKLC